ncbi:MAG: hypothetical protein CL678_12250 [Bdellovibrionaceae bacterium]|nr:hypothetical protein [Pseudobdellovibrionaceae bacterium]
MKNNKHTLTTVESKTEEWLTAEEVAVLLKKFRRKDGKPSVGAIRNLVYRKKLQGKKVLGRLLFYRPAVERFVDCCPTVGGKNGN